ncbi:hypothetical protein ACFX14_011836 [Malus domestica]
MCFPPAVSIPSARHGGNPDSLVVTSFVKQSATLNREGAENMKPRHLSDDIYQEVGDQVMSPISDGLSDGMKSEIAETVQSVYNKLTTSTSCKEGMEERKESYTSCRMGWFLR